MKICYDDFRMRFSKAKNRVSIKKTSKLFSGISSRDTSSSLNSTEAVYCE